MTGRRILVTGGAGFLGGHLCDRLVRDGHGVLCLDDFSTGRVENVRHLIGMPGFEVVEADVRKPVSAEVDEIYNLACPASPPAYQKDPIRTVQTCVDGAISVLDLARRTGAKILQASSSEVYGDPDTLPQREGDNGRTDPASPRACYEEGKRMAEVLCHDFRRAYGVRSCIVRIFNCYGPKMREDDGRVISTFVAQALRGQPLTVQGTGTQTRSFCYVDDMVEALVRIMAAPDTFTGPVNAGNPGEITVLDIAKRILAMTRSTSKIVHVAAAAGDPRRRCPDISLLTGATGWTPRISVDEGLALTVAHFQTNLGISDTNRHQKSVRQIT